MIKKLLLCSAFVAACSTMNAQNWGVLNNTQPFGKANAPVELNAPMKINLADDEMLYGYCNENDQLTGLGIGKTGTLHCAIHLTSDMLKNLAGSQITTIRVAMFSNNYLENSKIWIAKELGQPLYSQDVTLDNKWADFVLDTPYTLDGEGLYIGYTTTLTKIASNNDAYPLGVNTVSTPEGLYLAIEDGQWANYYEGDYGSLMLQCVVKGNIPQNDAKLDAIGSAIGLKGEKVSISGSLTNMGKQNITSVDLTYVVDGETKTLTGIQVEPAIKSAQTGSFSFEATAPSKTVPQKIEVTIDKVNGVEDEDPNNNTAEGTITSLSKIPHRRVVMEEFTGSWCGWCPRGAVAMEKLYEEYPDQFVGIAVHVNDNMSTSSYNALANGDQVIGYPLATVNRIIYCDPYYGTNGDNYDIKQDIEAQLAKLTVADIELEAVFNGEDKKSLTATSQTTFYFTSDDNPYKLAYVVIEDGVIGTQANSFANNTSMEWPDDLAFLVNEPLYITDFVFNDIARNIHTCMGLSNSVEGSITDGETKTHTYNINLPSTVKNPENLKLAVLLLDTQSGEVMNAAQVALGSGVGIENAELKPFETVVFAENGVLNVSTPEEGTMTVSVYAENGSLVASQEFVGNTTLPVNGLKGVYVVRTTDGNNVSVHKVVL